MTEQEREAATLAMFQAVPIEIREDLAQALDWARQVLTMHEGAGHVFQVTLHHSHKRELCCTFSKPEWTGEHCSRAMDTASEAVVMAVCERLNEEGEP